MSRCTQAVRLQRRINVANVANAMKLSQMEKNKRLKKIARGRRVRGRVLMMQARNAGYEGHLASSRGRDQPINLLGVRDVRRLAQYRPSDWDNTRLGNAECEERAILTNAILGEAALEAALPHVEHLLRHILDITVEQCLSGGRNRLRPSTLFEAMRWMVGTTRYETLIPPLSPVDTLREPIVDNNAAKSRDSRRSEELENSEESEEPEGGSGRCENGDLEVPCVFESAVVVDDDDDDVCFLV